MAQALNEERERGMGIVKTESERTRGGNRIIETGICEAFGSRPSGILVGLLPRVPLGISGRVQGAMNLDIAKRSMSEIILLPVFFFFWKKTN